jgi:hypothetical protein
VINPFNFGMILAVVALTSIASTGIPTIVSSSEYDWEHDKWTKYDGGYKSDG